MSPFRNATMKWHCKKLPSFTKRICVLAARATLLILICLTGLSAPPQIYPGGVVDLAAFRTEMAPGLLISLFGANLSEHTLSAAAPLPNQLAGVAVEVIDEQTALKAPLLFVSPGQINAQLPHGLSGERFSLRVQHSGGVSPLVSLSLASAAPRLFTLSQDGKGPVAAVRPDGRLVTPDHPAQIGETISLYLLGLGSVSPPLASGAAATGPAPTVAPVEVYVNSAAAPIFYSGAAPSFPGLYQVNFVVPFVYAQRAATLTVRTVGKESQPGVTLPLAQPSEFHVSVHGKPANDGSRAHPWDLATALSHPPAVKPGDIIWIHGGTYRGSYRSELKGAPSLPIHVRQSPGERVIIDGESSSTETLVVNGAWTWYWDFELMFSDPKRITDTPGSFPGDIPRSTCVTVYGPETKFINMVLHDCSNGFGLWTPAENAEIYGCLIYYNGWSGAGAGHGHGIYAQNRTGIKSIRENIIFSQFNIGIQPYGSAAAFVEGFDIEGNIVFNNGVIGTGGFRNDNILVAGGGTPKTRIRLLSNFTYHTPASVNGRSRIGWTWDALNNDVIIRDNFWVGGAPAIEVSRWQSTQFTGNTVFSRSRNVEVFPPDSITELHYQWDNNTYYGYDNFRFRGEGMLFRDWKSHTGYDATSVLHNRNPSGVWKFVRPNKYQTGRANIVIYNWDLLDRVSVDLSTVLKPGEAFEIRDAQNFHGPPVRSGTYTGGTLAIPMNALSVSLPVGRVPTPPKHTAPEFAVFVLLKTLSSSDTLNTEVFNISRPRHNR